MKQQTYINKEDFERILTDDKASLQTLPTLML